MAYTRAFYVLIIAIAVGGMMWQGAGFADLFAGSSPGEDLDSADKLRDDASSNTVNTNFTGDARASDGSLVGLVVSGGSAIADMLGFVAWLPAEIMELGMPYWAARPLGILATTIISIGVIQAIIGRIIQ